MDELSRIRSTQLDLLIRIDHWKDHLRRLECFIPPEPTETTLDVSDTVSIRANPAEEERLNTLTRQIIQDLAPWRKGPFQILGVDIDAEWRSDLKWKRLEPALPELRNRRIADIGCNNGYYMFRLLPYEPQLVIGMDPSSRCYYQFDFLQRLARHPALHFEPIGIEHLAPFPEFFDVVFCMGVIYHRRDPYTACRMLFDCMRRGGTLLLESLVIPGDDPVCLCPPDRYAKMRNVWYLPTDACLAVWLTKAGFRNIEFVSSQVQTTTNEQRKTELAPYESLSDFLDPKDPDLTIEGLPAPRRTIVRAEKLN